MGRSCCLIQSLATNTDSECVEMLKALFLGQLGGVTSGEAPEPVVIGQERHSSAPECHW